MKVVFIVRSSLFNARGGDTLQVTEIARNLEMLGIDVEIKPTTSKIAYNQFDLLHFFKLHVLLIYFATSIEHRYHF